MSVSINGGYHRYIYKGNDCESWESFWIVNGMKSMMNYIIFMIFNNKILHQLLRFKNYWNSSGSNSIIIMSKTNILAKGIQINNHCVELDSNRAS